MAAVMAQEIGDLDQLMQQQSFDKINDWLTQNMYCYGAVYSGRELMEKSAEELFHPLIILITYGINIPKYINCSKNKQKGEEL